MENEQAIRALHQAKAAIEQALASLDGASEGPRLQGKADLLHGYKAIADFLGVSRRQAEYWAESAGLPVFKIRRTVCGRRADLQAWIDERAG